MRQVPLHPGRPAHHLLIGSGKASRHFERYFASLESPTLIVSTWKQPRSITRHPFSGQHAPTHVWLLVSDSAIERVARSCREIVKEFNLEEPFLLHAAGASVVDGVRGVHPLMTFGPSLYPIESYSKIPFVIEDLADGASTESILGGIPNPSVFLRPRDRALYHALVSASGNFPSMLWAEIFRLFEERLQLPRELLAPYLFQTLANTLREGDSAITGPLVRGDHATIRKHKAALERETLLPLYEAFESFFTRSTQPARTSDEPT
jgi:hypothetical protein